MSDTSKPVDHEAGFLMWLNGPRRSQLGQRGAVIKKGRDVMKTVDLSYYGNPSDNEVKKRTLRFRTIDVRGNRAVDYGDFTADKNDWFCENDEIARLLAFLHTEVAHTGRYQVVDIDSPGAALVDLLESSHVNPQVIVDALVQHTNVAEIVSLIASSDIGRSAAQSVVLESRRKLVAQLRRLVDRPGATETEIQRLIGDAYWIFGGRYVGVADRRSFIPLDQTDIPLLGADGTLHIVELKGPDIDKLLVRHRNHWIVGPAVHEATAQAMNYLRSFDEHGSGLSTMYNNELGQRYDMSRIFATVVIGHSDHHRPADAEREVVARTLRQYTAGLNRVEVITYDQLVDAAERALVFEHDSTSAASMQRM
ncbi:Shedu anti-phage system protein SduA domain-containing protein [Nocardia veterana]|uniref:DUF4263 domain-containing protein n=1 Tax=Nocardia veterana TaxID=132249 RepID=A0A7X6M2G5_9NOCA|nr:Shedu anti-phage system protein SduA domain-containing protein [Nocardia veterana]NKY88165.1 DUF4263 domain-containing protein [Nocardia veterana]